MNWRNLFFYTDKGKTFFGTNFGGNGGRQEATRRLLLNKVRFIVKTNMSEIEASPVTIESVTASAVSLLAEVDMGLMITNVVEQEVAQEPPTIENQRQVLRDYFNEAYEMHLSNGDIPFLEIEDKEEKRKQAFEFLKSCRGDLFFEDSHYSRGDFSVDLILEMLNFANDYYRSHSDDILVTEAAIHFVNKYTFKKIFYHFQCVIGFEYMDELCR